MSLYYSGSESNIHAIISSLSAQNYAINSGGAISFLDRNTAYGIKIVQHQWYNNRYYLFIIPLAMATIAYIPIYQKLMYIIKNRLSALLLLATIIGSIALFAVAIDWGRFIYIHLVSLFLLSFISPNKTQNHFVWFSDKLKIKTVFIFLIIYSTLWHIPHAGSVFAKTFRQPAFIALVTPYAKIVRYYLS